jgi:hypothetical protein
MALDIVKSIKSSRRSGSFFLAIISFLRKADGNDLAELEMFLGLLKNSVTFIWNLNFI